ncbi:hypothetical protein BURKHO8Y_140379 [Burkholderia sp. 8Y]|nr:hypothetical protein BURKHO8Y_140379 [Burkholderia sp. 8Y]
MMKSGESRNESAGFMENPKFDFENSIVDEASNDVAMTDTLLATSKRSGPFLSHSLYVILQRDRCAKLPQTCVFTQDCDSSRCRRNDSGQGFITLRDDKPRIRMIR